MAASAAVPSRGDVEMIGREELLAGIGRLLDDTECGVCLLTGGAGVGKSRLLEALTVRLRDGGRRVSRVTGLPAGASFPFASIAHLLPAPALAGGALDPLSAFVALRATVWNGDDDPCVLVADDLHLVDPSSLAVVAQLVAAGLVTVVGTVRAGAPLPETVVALGAQPAARWVEVGPLERTDTDRLVAGLLGGPVEPALADALWERTLGNPLYVAELVEASRLAGGIERDGERWTLRHRLVPSRRLAEAVGARLAVLDPEARRALEFIALTEPLPAALGLELLAPAVVSALIEGDLVRETAGEQGAQWRTGHPLYGELLRRPMSRAHRRQVLAGPLARLTGPTGSSAALATQVTGWRLEAGLAVEADEFRRALLYAEAGWDWGLAARLARFGLERGLPGAVETRAQALHLLGRHREVIDDAREAIRTGHEPAALLEWLHIEARALFWGEGDYDATAAVMERAAEVAGPLRLRWVDTIGAVEDAWAGRLDEVEALFASFAAAGLDDDPDPVVRLLILVARLEAARQRGHLTDAMVIGDEGRRLATHQHVGAARAGRFRTVWCAALTDAGRAEEAATVAHDDIEQAMLVGAVVPQSWTAWCLGRALADLGRLASAEQWLTMARDLARTYDLRMNDDLATAALAVVWAQRGDAALSRQAIAELADRTRLAGFVGEEVTRGLAWARYGAGRPAEAVADLREAVLDASRRGLGGSVVRSLVALCRMGDGAWVHEHAGLLDGLRHPVVPALLHQAAGVAHDDPVRLERAAEGYAAAGMALVAAEVMTASAASWRRRGDAGAAGRATERAAALSAACEGLVVSGTVIGDGPTPLTRREREVATLAATGMASREISTRLYLSTRTVDNHLSSVYAKLGVAGRHELTDALASRN